MKIDYQVFISFKNSDDETEEDTLDKEIAYKVYKYLMDRGLNVFFSPVTLKALGRDSWSEEIDIALKESKVFIAVGTQKTYMELKHPQSERITFITEKKYDDSKVIYSYIGANMTLDELPNELKYFECFQDNVENELDRLLKTIQNHLSKYICNLNYTSSKNNISQGYDIFISYSSKDSHIAFMLCEALENEGLTCWIAPRDVKAGHYANSIVEGIESSKLFILLFSQNSNDSVPVLNELEMAMGNKLLIIPARIEEVLPSKAMKFYLMATHWFDVLDAKSVDDFNEFVSVVKKNLGKNENIDTIHTVKPPKIVNKKNRYLKKIYLFIALIASIALVISIFSWNKALTNKNEALTIKKAEKSKVEILANKLISQTKEAQHWKEEYFKLKEKYKDYPQITVQAEKIQEREGYEKAVSFYTSIETDKIKKEILTPPKSKSNNKEETSDTISTKLEPITSISSIESQVTDNMIIPIDEGAKPIDANKYRKKALIIENYNYVKLPKLQDTSSSLDKLKTTLEELGFDVTSKKNLNFKEFHRAIEKFSEELSKEPNTIGFIYYGGHGYQLGNKNYLIPVNLDIQNKLSIKYKAINLNEILETLSLSNTKLNMFFLDINTKKYLHSTPSNTLLMYSSSGDRVEDNTIFIDSLTNQIKKPINIGLITNNIRNEVSNITDNEQIPIIISNSIPLITINNIIENSKCLLVIASRRTLLDAKKYIDDEIVAFDKDIKIFLAPNGYYAIAIGLIDENNSREIIQELKEKELIPQDSICSRANKFVEVNLKTTIPVDEGTTNIFLDVIKNTVLKSIGIEESK